MKRRALLVLVFIAILPACTPAQQTPPTLTAPSNPLPIPSATALPLPSATATLRLEATPAPTPTRRVAPQATPTTPSKDAVRYADRPYWRAILGWPDECEEAFQDEPRKKHDSGDITFYEVGDKHYLAFVHCTMGTYWAQDYIYWLDEHTARRRVKPVSLTELTWDDSQGWAPHEVYQVYGSYLTYHPETHSLTNPVVGRGLKDCGSFYRYHLEQDHFVLDEAQYQDCDDQPHKLAGQWEVIYPPPLDLDPFQPAPTEDRPAGAASDLRAAPDGSLWLITPQGAGHRRAGRWELHSRAYSRLLGFDSSGRAWLLSEDGDTAYAWDGDTWATFGPESGWQPLSPWFDWWPPRSSGESIVSDKEGRLWLSASTDLRAFDGQRWERYSAPQVGFTHTAEMMATGPDDFWLTDVIVDSEGDAWVADCAWLGPGPEGHGARWLADGEWQGQDSRVVASGCIYDLEVDPAGRVWAGVNGDLWRYTPGQSWEKIPHPEPDPASGRRWGFIVDLNLAPDGSAWVSLHRCGGGSCDTGQIALFQMTGATWTHVLELQSSRMPDLAFDADGAAWICANTGLYRFSAGRLEQIGGEQAASCLIEADPAGHVWLTLPGRGGLWVYNGETP